MGRHKKVHEVAPQPPIEVDARYKRFKDDLKKQETGLNALRQRWAPQTDSSFAAYCSLNPKALVQYDTITTALLSGILNGKKTNKHEIEEFLMGPDCAELRKHLGDNSLNENNHPDTPTKAATEPTPQEQSKVEKQKKRSQTERDSDEVELAEVPKKIKVAVKEQNQTSELLVGGLKAQMHALNEGLLRSQNELEAQKEINKTLTSIMTATVTAYDELKRQYDKLNQKNERTIYLTDEEFSGLKETLKSFAGKFVPGKTAQAEKMWSEQRLIRMYYFGASFSAPSNEYTNIKKITIIDTVNMIASLISGNPGNQTLKSDCFSILLQMIENNIELFNYLFNTLEMTGRDNSQDPVLKTYKLEDSPKILVNLFMAMSLYPRDASVIKILDYMKQSTSLIGHLEKVVNTHAFESISVFMFTLLATTNKVQPVIEQATIKQPPPHTLEAYLLNSNKTNQPAQKSLEVVAWNGCVSRNPQPSAKELADEILDLEGGNSHSNAYRSNGSSLK